MGYLCTNCLKEIDSYDVDLDDREDVYHIFCPECKNYELHEVDDLMMYPIKILNQKGYTTSFCCSGHGWEEIPSVYISFLDENYIPPFLPKDFVLEDDAFYEKMKWGKRNTSCNNCIAIRKYYHPVDRYSYNKSYCKNNIYLERIDLEKEILKTALDLIDWVDKLPYRHKVRYNLTIK